MNHTPVSEFGLDTPIPRNVRFTYNQKRNENGNTNFYQENR